VAVYNLANREDVYEKEEGPKYRTLGDTTGDKGLGRLMYSKGN